MKSLFQRQLAVIGRAALGSLFVLGGINKIINYAATQTAMEHVGLAPASVLLPATIAFELGAGLIVVGGIRRWLPWAAGALALFTLATNAYFHAFWTLEGDMRQVELSLFFKNLAIAGALVCLASQRRTQTAAASR